jgi:sulfur-oxidizing protein SoxY
VLCALVVTGGAALGPRPAAGQGSSRSGAGGDPAHRIQVDAPILADDPVAVPLTVSVEHPMEPEHYIKSLEVTLATDPVPQKGTFLFTPGSGRASIAYQMRSGQGGELTVAAECSQHGRFEARHTVRVAPGGCAVPAGGAVREAGGMPSVRADGRTRRGQAIPVWAALRHSSHTGLIERQGKLVPGRPAYFVERLTVFLGEERVSEFRLTPAISPDPKLRFFVKAEPGRAVRVVFVNNRGERWEASQPLT